MARPCTLTLPSGRTVRLHGEPRERSSTAKLGAFSADARAILRWTDVDALGTLELGDFHTLRVLLRRLGRLSEPPVAVRCDNCDALFRVRPSHAVEPGPFLDGELDDPELDARFEFGVPIELGEGLSVELAPLSVQRAAPFLRSPELPPTRAEQVRALGLSALGDARDPEQIAARLADLGEGELDALAALFEEAHYPPRLTAPHRCPSCGQSLWLGAPARRELSMLSERVAASAEPFMDADAFEALVRAEADAVFTEMGVDDVDLIVVEGPADCDDAGEPLLGSYQHEDPFDDVPHGAEVRIYHRTFANEQRDNGPYDVRAEIRETLRHELEHHLAQLAGHDPVGDEEDAEVAAEYTRRVGRRETRRRATQGMGRDLIGFARAAWPLLLVLGVLTLLWLVAGQ